MFSDVADAADHLVPGQQRQQPQGKVSPPHASGRRDGKDRQVAEQEIFFGLEQILPALQTAGIVPHFHAEKFHAPLVTGDAQNVAPHLAPKALFRDREWRRQNQVGVFGLLGVAVVTQVVGAVKREACPDRPAAQKRAQRVIEPGVFEQGAVRRVVHQDRQTQLPPTDDDHGHHKAQGIGPGDEKRHGQGDHAPSVQHQIRAHPVRALAQIRVLFGAQTGLGVGGHDKSMGKDAHLVPIDAHKQSQA